MARATDDSDSSASLGFEANLWLAANHLHNNLGAAKRSHIDVFVGRRNVSHYVVTYRPTNDRVPYPAPLQPVRGTPPPNLLSDEFRLVHNKLTDHIWNQ